VLAGPPASVSLLAIKASGHERDAGARGAVGAAHRARSPGRRGAVVAHLYRFTHGDSGRTFFHTVQADHLQQSVGLTEPKPSRCGLLKDGKLVAEGQDLRFELDSSSEAGLNHCNEGRDARAHDW
jgi:hypothetical protein